MANVTIDGGRCMGCGLCVAACPKKILALSDTVINAKGFHPAVMKDRPACTGCASCAVMCPHVCITVERG